MNYSEILRDPLWIKRRAEILERDKHQCQMCGEKEKKLHVHHRAYLGRLPWDYPDEYLVTLCEDCHDEEGELRPNVEEKLLRILRLKFFFRDLNALAIKFQSDEPKIFKPAEDDL